MLDISVMVSPERAAFVFNRQAVTELNHPLQGQEVADQGKKVSGIVRPPRESMM